MAASEEDHNYYSQTQRPSHLSDYSVESGQSSAVAAGDALPTLPALYYRQSQQYPQRPTITTNFDSHSANAQLQLPNSDPSVTDVSPDPHEFYRPYRDSFRRDTGSVYGGSDIDGVQREEGMTSTRTTQRTTLVSSRINGFNSTTPPRWNQPSERTSPLSEKSSAGTRTGPYAPRGRQSSLQALVNKFNQTPDEIPPLPIKSGSRPTSSNASPSSAHAPTSFKSRASSETLKSRKATAAKSHVHSKNTTGSTDKKRNNQGGGASSERSPTHSRKPPTIANNASATRSMTDLSKKPSPPDRRPLFGEVLNDGDADVAYGIPGSKVRRGSESNVYQNNSMFQDDTALGARKVSPSSPTAWYMGVTPSLEGINFDTIPSKRPDMHRRSRSDIVAGPFAIAPLSSTLNKNLTMMSPPQEQHSSDSSPSQSRNRNRSRSRIPIKSRRISTTSDSGNSTPSPPSSRLGYNGLRNKTPSKAGSHLPMPVETKTPDRNKRPTNPRRSPRHYNHSPPQSSPQLQAIISETPPAKSPPLRSSRPRQPVSTATTSASRARAAANIQERHADKKNKALPELGGVDLATRRERIQRAFTTKVKEKEIETERKRMSLMQDSQWHQSDKGSSSDNSLPAKTAPAAKTSFENLPGREQELFTAKASSKSSKEQDLTVNDSTRNNATAFDSMQEDSPTLGTAPFLEPVRYDGSELSSAETSGTAEDFFGKETVQVAKASGAVASNSAAGSSSEQSRPVLNRNLSSQSRFGTRFYGSDQDDAESIQIVLQDGPSDNNTQPAPSYAPMPEVQESPSLAEEYDPFRSADPDPHTSLSTNASTFNQSSWSPETQSTPRTARDSDSYNTISHVLDDYHDSSFMNSANINEFQQRLFAQSPHLARQGNWDPKKVTQLYLQSYKPSHSSALPAPLDPHSRTKIEQSSHGTTPAQDERSEAQPAEKEVLTNQNAARLQAPAPDPFAHRASASLSNADDWLNTSPSMLDWMAHQQLDTPVEEKGTKPFTFDKRPAAGPPQIDKSLPVLPGIVPSSGLGIDITVQAPREESSSMQVPQHLPEPNSRRGSPIRQDNLPRPESPTLRSSTPGSGATGKLSSTMSGSLTGQETPSRTNSVEVPIRKQRSRTNTEVDASSTVDSLKSTISASEQKRLNRRRNILKEIVDTESSFGKDMTVVVDIYKGTSNVILDSPEDVKVLFGNSADIVQFSMSFLDSLKQAVKTVYVLPRDKRWKTKRDSGATTGSNTTDDQSLSGIDLSDEEKDRKTSIGAAFDTHLTQMEKVYAEYLKNHDAANQKLQLLQKEEKVTIWLKECRAYAHDLTTAWDLDSLLVKPVQRILKYPLLLNELLAVTPENHPDYVAIDTAAREMVGVSVRINEAKKRADLVEQVNNSSLLPAKPKKKESETRMLLPKAFTRRTEKLKQQVGASDTVQDKAYDSIADKFGSHFFQLQVVMRDVEMYVMESQGWVNKFNEFIGTVEAFAASGPTTYPEIESKWQRFRLSVREIQMTALTDHISAVRKNVIDPMTSLLKLHDGPQKLMEKRKKRVMDYAKYRATKDRGEKPDKRTTELGEQFMAVNDTLKDELPKLFSLTGKLVEACLQNFVQLQLQWMNVWRVKLRQAIETHEIPPSFAIVATDFKADFAYIESQLVPLGICNGSLANDHVNLLNINISPVTGTNLLDDSRRPSYGDDSRSRTTSNATVDHGRPRGTSTSNNAPVITASDFGRSNEVFSNNLPYNPGSYAQVQPRPRARASSSTSTRNPMSPENQSSWRYQPNQQMNAQSNRPSTSTGRSYDSPPVSRPSYDSGHQSNDRLYPDESARYGREHRQSTVFSSAMPMSDSSRPHSPTEEPQSPPSFNVLFLAASVYEFNIDRARREAGYPYLTYVAGEIFDVIGEKGELWLAKNQDDSTNQVGWIWNKHFAKLAS